MKRKRKELCPSPLLDESPKRTKVHAQRKFAQGSNVNSPAITPVKEFERVDKANVEINPEPVELLPIRRPNTEDFLTFLCFRGTSLLPPNLNFFNTASIVDPNGQVHEIKGDSPKNGPIDTAAITKNGSGSTERPFIAFGVRKRADPIVISKQMEKKRRHALAIQALRRKYQEQKMAKIRAVTISKLSEKPNRNLVRSNSISKQQIEKIQQQQSSKPQENSSKVVPKEKVISTKHIDTASSNVRSSKLKPKMCLRSFRGRFVQQELPFRAVKKHKIKEKKMILKKIDDKKDKDENKDKKPTIKNVKETNTKVEMRVTRSNKIPIIKNKPVKRRILIPNTSILVKSHVLRSSANVQTRLSRRNGPGILVEKIPKQTVMKPKLKTANNKLPPKASKKDNEEVTEKKASKESRKSAEKQPVEKNKEVTTRKAESKQQDNSEQKFQRPTRKTKEAAAIYMEILSHKLVNNKKIDDEDNISIDSFPELPNAKRMEARENELKAKAKTTKKDSGEKKKINNTDSDKKPEKIKKEEVPKKSPNLRNKKSELSSDSDECLAKISKVQTKKQPVETSSNSDNECLAKIKLKKDKLVPKRETRQKTTKIESDSEESDDVKKVPKKRVTTRNRTESKTSSEKPEINYSDSDEEPLSKLTTKSSEKLKEELLKKQKELINSPPSTSTKTRRNLRNNSAKIEKEPKPKRECTKLPSNYLPMFSSSDDEEQFFYGFSLKSESKVETYSPAEVDLSSKDIGRRFGKEKVNMSNEQIEKWLKDSAMAGEEIPTETSFNPSIDTEKIKNSILGTPEKKNLTQNEDDKIYKSPSLIGDRKPIFKKEKPKISPTVGAFSANNESSIYAFEDENDVTVSTPFRRPSRRPSSTATSKSEDENDQTKFRKPVVLKLDETKPKPRTNQANKTSKSTELNTEYKVPNSPTSSSSSSKVSRIKNRVKVEVCNPVKKSEFPCNGPGELVEAPTFYPTEKEFQDPLEYIEKISAQAEQFSICKIVPPTSFKPECKVSDDMRFTSYNQYVHKMLHRWGPNFKELMAIKKYLQTQNINLTQPPWIGGMEVDLPRLYQTVQSLGGLKEVIEKEKWSKVSDMMRIPKSAQDRVTKLDDIYCKYLLPYDTLSPDEREKLLDEVETEWAKRESKTLQKMQKTSSESEESEDEDSDFDNDMEECFVKGRNMALNTFYRIARNTMSMLFKNSDPTVDEVEQEFWKNVEFRQNHICVHSGSIDSGSCGYGFAVSKNSPFARHAWNLKVLTNNSGSLLRSLGPMMGVTVPTLHVGMVFSACCWYRDPHSLPWIEYLHTGGSKIWYGIPDSIGNNFRKTLMKLVPNYCQNKEIWLPVDTVMLPPSLLIESGVSLSRIVQEPGQFIVVFPKAFTSSISTGYVVSESVFFAPCSWLKTAQKTFDLLKASSEPSMFSLDKLYLSIVNDQRTSVDVLKQMIPIISKISADEKSKRDQLKSLKVVKFEKLPPLDEPNTKRRRKKNLDDGDYECEICRANLFISMVIEQEDVYCLDHAIEQIKKDIITPNNCKLLYTYSIEDLNGLIMKINGLIEQKLSKKVFNKFSGMPTLLK